MHHTRLSVLLFAALAIPAPAHAQHIIADISIHSGPVAGHFIVTDPDSYRPRTIVEVGPRYHWRPVTVYRVHRGYGWYRAHGYREARIWYDPHQRFYYDRYHDGLREIAVYVRDGRYYRDDWSRHDGYRSDRDDDDYHR
jgi:hypothetical protein